MSATCLNWIYLETTNQENRMKVFLIYIRDEDFYHNLTEENGKPESGEIIKVMAFPPMGIQTLAPVLRSMDMK
jgi:hypothetical protein